MDPAIRLFLTNQRRALLAESSALKLEADAILARRAGVIQQAEDIKKFLDDNPEIKASNYTSPNVT